MKWPWKQPKTKRPTKSVAIPIYPNQWQRIGLSQPERVTREEMERITKIGEREQ